MVIIMNEAIDYTKQVYKLSIVGLIGSIVLGFGILFLIPCLTQAINIKQNYNKYDYILIDKSILYCISGLFMSIVSIIIFLYLIPSMV